MKFARLLATSGIVTVLAANVGGSAFAGETRTYTYDALGRLTVQKSTGTVNANETHSICYDDAGNRLDYVSNTSGMPEQCTQTTAPTPSPTPTPTPTPTPSTIQITDTNLNVLAAHQSTYFCSIGSVYGYNWEFCQLSSNNVVVYNAYASPTLDPGYSMPMQKRLDVASASYGTGVAP